MASRYATQPARILAAEQHLTIRELAESIGEDPTHLGNALRGTAFPSERIREQLPLVLGRPLSELFSPDRLRMPYSGPRGRNGGRRKAAES